MKKKNLKQNEFAGKKGFVISFDAMVAMLVLFIMFTVATSYLGKVVFEAESSSILKEVAMDTITVLEKGNTLENSIKKDKVTDIRSFLNKLPYSICADLRVYAETDLANPALTALRPGCKLNFEEVAIMKRSIVVENNGNADLYLAEIRTWYRVSE